MPAPCTARRLAEDGGKRVLVLERRSHIGGNAYDCPDRAGVLIHQYGPHIFHTNDQRVYHYLTRFTAWLDYPHKVVASIPDEKGGRMQFPVPFNLTSMETAFGPEKGKRAGRKAHRRLRSGEKGHHPGAPAESRP